MENLSLVIFSIFVQAAIGIIVFVAIGRLLNKDAVFKKAMFTAAGLSIIGMLTSVLHLGRPLNAIRALNQFSTSWLSREIWFTSFFVGLTVLALILLLKKQQKKGFYSILLYIAAIVGLVDVFFMASIYSHTGVPVWQGNSIYFEFYTASISMGAILFLALSGKEAEKMKRIIALTIAAAVVIQIAAAVPNLITLGLSTNGALIKSMSILGDMTFLTAIKWGFILIGAGFVLWMAKDKESKSESRILISSTILLLVGQGVGRYLFYASMVVTGVGIS